MPEVETAAYERIRNFWRTDALRMEIGNAAMTSSTSRDVGESAPDGPVYTSVDADNPQVMTMTIKGTDADVALAVTYERVRLRRTVAAGEAILFEGTFSPVAINVAADELTVTVNIEIPDIA